MTTNTMHGAMPGKVTPNKKAAGGKTTTATNSGSITDSTGSDLALTTTANEARIDSRLLAQGFGNKHRPVLALVDKYLCHLEKFGKVLFKKAPSTGSKTGQSERFALLNEDQAYLLLSLSRNTETVVNLKAKLITAFGNARRAADMRQTEYLPAYHALHDQIKALDDGSTSARFMHMNCNKALNKFAGLEAGQRASASVPKQALMIVGQMLMTAAMQSAHDSKEAYQRAKASLLALTAVTMLEGAP